MLQPLRPIIGASNRLSTRRSPRLWPSHAAPPPRVARTRRPARAARVSHGHPTSGSEPSSASPAARLPPRAGRAHRLTGHRPKHKVLRPRPARRLVFRWFCIARFGAAVARASPAAPLPSTHELSREVPAPFGRRARPVLMSCGISHII